jgi:dTDP-6-deoxy-L-talose 4-dehydrogenase (NAD+)
VKISVTGASGFIGLHVVRELLDRNADVLAVTRNAAKLGPTGSRVQILEMDIARPSPDQIFRAAQADCLIHLAWDGLPNYGSLHHFETELSRQYSFIKAAVDAGLRAVLVSGTCFEYGMQHGPLSEDAATLPANPYGLAKDVLRKQLEFLNKGNAFNLTWARMFYLYGDGQSSNSLFPQLRDAASRGEKTFDMSGGEQLRDYLPVTEAARLIVELAFRRVNAGPVNVCSGQPTSVRSMVERWIKDNNWKIELNLGRHPYSEYEPMAFWGMRSKLDSLLEDR